MKDTMKEFIEDENVNKDLEASIPDEAKEGPVDGNSPDNKIDVSKLSVDELLRLYKEKYPDDYNAFLDKIHKQFEN